MRFAITGKWKDGYTHDGLLYCVQRIEEMLMAYTSHLYKVPVYNSFLLTYEYLHVYNTVEEKLIDQAHLKNVLDEFIDTFKSDIVVKEHFSNAQIDYFTGRLLGSSVSEQKRTLQYIAQVMSDYPMWCVESLKKAVNTPKEKKKIEKALRSYVPMIIAIGYHPFYIYHTCKNIFTEGAYGVAAFDTFLNTFDGADKNYTVYFIVDKRIEKFRQILTERLRLSFDKDKKSEKLSCDSNRQVCVHFEESALDPNGAAHKAFMNFELFMRFYRFLGNRDREWIGEKCLVVDESDNCVYPHFGPERFFYSQDYDDKTLGKNSERIITQLMKNVGGNDFYKIDRVIQTHNTAISSQDINNAFLNLWSVVEIIGVDGFDRDTSKIKRILNNIVPILKRNYINRVVEEMHDYLKGNLCEEEYSQILSAVDIDGSEQLKVACIVALKEYDEARKKAYSFLKDYPLIRSRISQLYEDVFKTKRKFLAELNRYEQRLIWHIQRLYRVRNSIIHSGEIDDNMVSLVEHLHSYVDEVTLDLVSRMTGQNSLGTVANVLLDAQVFIENCEKEKNINNGLNIEELRLFLQ